MAVGASGSSVAVGCDPLTLGTKTEAGVGVATGGARLGSLERMMGSKAMVEPVR